MCRSFQLAIILFLFSTTTLQAQFSGAGAGTSGQPFIVTNPTQLNEIRNNLDAFYELANDIDMGPSTSQSGGDFYNGGAGWTAIGSSSSVFSGQLDGKGYAISNLTINRTSNGQFAALFAQLGRNGSNQGVIKNLNMVNVNISGTREVGAIAGSNGDNAFETEISNCTVTGTVTGNSIHVGGLVGFFRGKIHRCSSSATVSGSGVVGGLVGAYYGTMTESFATGSVSGQNTIGGLIGRHHSGMVQNSYATGNVTASNSSLNAGGLTGWMNDNGPRAEYCYARGKVTISNDAAGNGALGRGSTAVGSDRVKGVFFDYSACGRLEEFSPAKALQSTQMVNASSFEGYDFSASGAWAINEGQSYPYLRWQGSAQTFNQPPATPSNPVPDVTSLSDIRAQCSVNQQPTAPTAKDACGNTLTGVTETTFPVERQDTIELTWTYTSNNGQTTTQKQKLIIADTEAPVASKATLDTLRSQCSISNITAPKATDNCQGEITGTTTTTFPITANDTTVVTWTYKDSLGNEATQKQIVIIKDTTAPVASTANLSNVVGNCDGPITTSDFTTPTATDNCSGTLTGVSNVTFPITATGETMVTWTYTDGTGNTTSQQQKFIIPVSKSAAVDTSLCSGSAFTFPDGTNWDGTVLSQVSKLRTSEFSCDSLVTTNITILAAPTADLGLDTVFYCPGERLAFGIDETQVDFATYRIFALGGEAVDDSLSFEVTENLVLPLDGNKVTLELTGTNGCSSTDEVILINNDIQSLNFAIGFIQGDPTISINNSFVPEEADSLLWDFGDGNTNSIDLNPTTHTYQQNGNFEISLTIYNECGSKSQSLEYSIVNACEIEDTSIIEDGRTLTASAEGLSYQWYNCATESNVVGGTMRTLTPQETGEYSVRLNNGICSVESECVFFEFVPLHLEDFSVEVYPNPVSKILVVRLPVSQEKTVELINLSGQLIARHKLTPDKSTIDVSKYEQGVYLIKILAAEQMTTRRIVIE